MDTHMDAKVLLRAAELIDQGHCKGTHAIKNGAALRLEVKPDAARIADADSWCLVGAVVVAQYELTGASDYKLAQRLCDAGYSPLWNDDPRRTAEEVSGMFREEAARVERAADAAEAPTP